MIPLAIGDWSTPAISWLLRASLQAAVLVGLVLLLQYLLGRRLSARWRANLWLIVLLRLLIPVLPQSPISLFNLARLLPSRPSHVATTSVPLRINAPAIPASPERATDIAIPVSAAVAAHSTMAPIAPFENQQSRSDIPLRPSTLGTWQSAIPLLYLTIVLLLTLRVLIATLRLSFAVRRLQPIDDPDLLSLLKLC